MATRTHCHHNKDSKIKEDGYGEMANIKTKMRVEEK